MHRTPPFKSLLLQNAGHRVNPKDFKLEVFNPDATGGLGESHQ